MLKKCLWAARVQGRILLALDSWWLRVEDGPQAGATTRGGFGRSFVPGSAPPGVRGSTSYNVGSAEGACFSGAGEVCRAFQFLRFATLRWNEKVGNAFLGFVNDPRVTIAKGLAGVFGLRALYAYGAAHLATAGEERQK